MRELQKAEVKEDSMSRNTIIFLSTFRIHLINKVAKNKEKFEQRNL